MEAIFTLPYSEYEVINQLKSKLGKRAETKGLSFYVPTSRQQKGIDFLIQNNKNNTSLRVQVKSSRSYASKPNEIKTNNKFKYYFWFTNFIDKYEPNVADYYILFGLYPVYSQLKNIKSKPDFWESIILCFSDHEMGEFLNNVKTKKEKKKDGHFDLCFNEPDRVYVNRGMENLPEYSKNLLVNKIKELENKLSKN